MSNSVNQFKTIEKFKNGIKRKRLDPTAIYKHTWFDWYDFCFTWFAKKHKQRLKFFIFVLPYLKNWFMKNVSVNQGSRCFKRPILFDMRYLVIRSMVGEISSFFSKDHATVSACYCREYKLLCRVLPLRYGHGIIDTYHRLLYDASFQC